MEKLLKQLAISAINNKLNNTQILSKNDLIQRYNEFSLPKATFITLKQNGNLRGCIGSLVAHRDLYDDIVSNAQSAAFSDPRFKPLCLEELDITTLEISILSESQEVFYTDTEDLKSKNEVGRDGIILKFKNQQATFLPQVWEDLNSFELFFSHLCQKARLSFDCLSSHPQIFKYNVKKI